MNDAPARLDSLTGLRFVAALLVFVHARRRRRGGANTAVRWTGSRRCRATRCRSSRAERIRAGVVAAAGRQRAGFLPAARGADRAATGSCGRSRSRSSPGRGAWARPDRRWPNLTLLQAWVPVEDYYYGYNSVTWSLSVEVFFYLAFAVGPVAAAGAGGGAGGRRSPGACCSCSCSNASALGYAPHGGVDIVSWLQLVCPVTRLPEFMLGVLLALGGPRLVLERPGRPGGAARGGGARADRVGGWRAGGALGRPGAVRAVAGRVRPARRVRCRHPARVARDDPARRVVVRALPPPSAGDPRRDAGRAGSRRDASRPPCRSSPRRSPCRSR